jgi:hypothetical protein
MQRSIIHRYQTQKRIYILGGHHAAMFHCKTKLLSSSAKQNFSPAEAIDTFK